MYSRYDCLDSGKVDIKDVKVDAIHYQRACISIEPIVICALFPFCFGNVLKYLFRADYKGCKQSDLEKALSYIAICQQRPNEMRRVIEIITGEHVRMLLTPSTNKYIQCLLKDTSGTTIYRLAGMIKDDIRKLGTDDAN